MCLILAGAHVNAKMTSVDPDHKKTWTHGVTAIYFAAESGHPEVVKYLKKCGADENMRGPSAPGNSVYSLGHLPIEVARNNVNNTTRGFRAVVEFLESSFVSLGCRRAY